jgi:hypothetical protein
LIRSVRETAQTYMGWSGRWSTILVHYLVLGSMDVLRDYGTALLILSAMQLVAAVVFFRFVLELPVGQALLAGILFYAVLLAAMPRPQQNLYFLTCTVEYQLICTTTIALFTLIKVLRDGALANLAICIAILVVCGEHELIALCLVLAFATIYVARRMQGERSRRLLLFTAVAGVGLAITAFAPGNFRRAAKNPMELTPATFLLAASEPLHLVRSVVLSAAVMLAAFLWIQYVSERPQTSRNAGPMDRRLVAVVTVTMALVLTILPSLALHEHLPRSITVALSFVLFGGALYLFLFRRHLTRWTSPRLKAAAGIALAAALLMSPNTRSAYHALHVDRAIWRAQMTERLTAHEPDVLMPQVEPPSPLLNVPGAWSADPNNWLNGCVARFMHARSVVAPADGAPAMVRKLAP